ncbi:MAG TPA: 30S ribosomal protein S21 [Terracidiphilus sp.]|nr:30S ribosomal protein S21 [Terracidiphilus sp.]
MEKLQNQSIFPEIFQPTTKVMAVFSCGTGRLGRWKTFRYDEKAYRQVWRWTLLAEVRVQEGEPLENALRRFKRKVQQEDIIKEVKRHSYYLKPGEKRRVKAALARKRNRKKARKEQD